MTPTTWVVTMLSFVSVIYLVTSGGYLFAGRPGMALAFIDYVLANAGLVWDAIQMGSH